MNRSFMKVTIRPYKCFDEPDPPFKASRESIYHVRVTVFYQNDKSLLRLTSLFGRIDTKIQEIFKEIFSGYQSQIVGQEASKDKRFCADFHLNEDGIEPLMVQIQNYLNNEGDFEVSIKSRSDNCCLAYSKI